jgi:hypothetical protein
MSKYTAFGEKNYENCQLFNSKTIQKKANEFHKLGEKTYRLYDIPHGSILKCIIVCPFCIKQVSVENYLDHYSENHLNRTMRMNIINHVDIQLSEEQECPFCVNTVPARDYHKHFVRCYVLTNGSSDYIKNKYKIICMLCHDTVLWVEWLQHRHAHLCSITQHLCSCGIELIGTWNFLKHIEECKYFSDKYNREYICQNCGIEVACPKLDSHIIYCYRANNWNICHKCGLLYPVDILHDCDISICTINENSKKKKHACQYCDEYYQIADSSLHESGKCVKIREDKWDEEVKEVMDVKSEEDQELSNFYEQILSEIIQKEKIAASYCSDIPKLIQYLIITEDFDLFVKAGIILKIIGNFILSEIIEVSSQNCKLLMDIHAVLNNDINLPSDEKKVLLAIVQQIIDLQ